MCKRSEPAPRRRVGKPADIAEAALFLLDPKT
ncbi:MAG: hypothetical protein JWO08_939, partial [Verrucomicrobiaceae bacterium]|nr:hypothetical protein [Verrucomicrobiaceae bacterium]